MLRSAVSGTKYRCDGEEEARLRAGNVQLWGGMLPVHMACVCLRA